MKPTIYSEYAPLKKILIHTPGKEHRQLVPWEGDHPLMGSNPRQYRELQRDHADLKKCLVEAAGAENVLELTALLHEIFEQADRPLREEMLAHTLGKASERYIKSLAEEENIQLEDVETKNIVADLIEGYPRLWRVKGGRLPEIIIPPKREMMWVRDSSATTPAGIMINSMASNRRQLEPALLSTLFKYHPMFEPDSVFLDMVAFNRELHQNQSSTGLQFRHLMEGGNMLVLSKDTLAIGVGMHDFLYSNRTTRAAFNLLLQHLFNKEAKHPIRRVYLVNVPDLRGFIHLDTVFNMFGPKAAIMMPYIFGYPKPGGPDSAKKLLQQFVGWLRVTMGHNQTDFSKIPTLAQFEHSGKVEIYDREYIEKTGQIQPIPGKAPYFIDQLVEDQLLDMNRLSWIGGEPDDYLSPFEHLRVALFEQHNMAGNVFTTSPFKAIAYHRNPATTEALEKNMKKIDPEASLVLMSSNELRTDDGGPHCLTMPLLREE